MRRVCRRRVVRPRRGTRRGRLHRELDRRRRETRARPGGTDRLGCGLGSRAPRGGVGISAPVPIPVCRLGGYTVTPTGVWREWQGGGGGGARRARARRPTARRAVR